LQFLGNVAAQNPTTVVQRVSKTTFVVNCDKTPKHPLGYLHIMFTKPENGLSICEKNVSCSCGYTKANVKML